MWRRRFGQDHLASFRIKASDIVGLLICKPQNAIVVEYGRVRVDLGTSGWVILGDLTGFGVELADVTAGDCREPDVAFFVRDQTVGARIAGLQRIFLELSGLRIKPA